MSALYYREREPEGEPEGLLVLHHGRGSDELDLLGLADVLDPGRRLHVVSPRAPLQLEGSPGYHWYLVPRVGYPDPVTFAAAYGALAEFHDELWERTGIGPERTVLGGFSMGAVMSYALGSARDRPAPGGVLAFSGFIPTIEGWEPGARAAPGTARVHLPRVPRPGDLGGVRPRGGAAADAGRLESPTTSSRAPTTSTPATCRWRPWLERALAAAGTRESA